MDINSFKELDEKKQLEKILDTCIYVSKNAKHVQINKNMIKELAKKDFNIYAHWLSSNPFEILKLETEDIVNFLVIFESIDFSFWGDPKWIIKTKVGELDGSVALMYSLLGLMKNKGHLNFEQITLEEFRNSLIGNVDIPLLKERYDIIVEVSKIINSKMQGNFYKYIYNIKSDLLLFNVIINNFPSFEDYRLYKDKKIYFYKLAQLLTSDILHIRKLKENIEIDCSNLVGCADYKIPQVLRGLGILEYDEELSSLVDNKKEIKENSIYEIEIRASMIVAIKLIKQELNNKFDSIDINDIIWSLGQDKSRQLLPYHLTRTTSY